MAFKIAVRDVTPKVREELWPVQVAVGVPKASLLQQYNNMAHFHVLKGCFSTNCRSNGQIKATKHNIPGMVTM